jgi:hypothetical protein
LAERFIGEVEPPQRGIGVRAMTMSASGPKTEVSGLKSDFRSTPETGHRRPGRPCQFRASKRLMHRSKQHLYSITASARLSNVAGISMPSTLAVLSGVNNRVLNYREFSFGPNCAFRFNFQRVAQRGQASYVVAVMAPSDFAQL